MNANHTATRSASAGGWTWRTGLGVGLAVLAAGVAAAASPVVDIRRFGAVPDGQTLATAAIQAAVDEAAARGGGLVLAPPGVYLTGTIRLRDHVTLYLEGGAVLLASLRQEDFPERAVVYAEGVRNVGVAGRGAIDGHGTVSTEFPKVRAHLLYFVECRDVRVREVTLRHSTTWVQHYRRCDGVTIDGVTVFSRINPNIEGPRHLPGAPGRNEDGLNLNACRDVRVANCRIYSDDDGLVLKSTSERPCRNVAVSNCVISSNASGIKFGTESGGGFQNVTVSNCAIYDTRNAGLALEIVDGGLMDRVVVSNLVMDNVKGSAIFLRLGDRGRPYRGEHPGVGAMRNVTISNVAATRVGDWIEPEGRRVIGCPIAGLPDRPIENVSLRNIRIQFLGGGTAEDARRDIPERRDAYPSCRMFGTLPAYAFFVRHVNNCSFENIDVTFQHEDQRPALVCEDVEGLRVVGFEAQSSPRLEGGLIQLRNVRGAMIQASGWRRPANQLVEQDERTSGAVLWANRR